MLWQLLSQVKALTAKITGRIFVAYLGAVMVTYLLAATAATQSVLASLEAMGVAVTMGERLSTTGRDLIGMFPAYGAIIAIALAIALPIFLFTTAESDLIERPNNWSSMTSPSTVAV